MANSVNPLRSGSPSIPESSQAGGIGSQSRARADAARPQPGPGLVGRLQNLAGNARARLTGQTRGDGQSASGVGARTPTAVLPTTLKTSSSPEVLRTAAGGGSPESGKITDAHVNRVIDTIMSRFGKFIPSGQEPKASRVALLSPERFARVRKQIAQRSGQGARVDKNVLGFALIGGTKKIDGRDVSVVLPNSIPRSVGTGPSAEDVLGHDMLHAAQSPKFHTWANQLSRRLKRDPDVKANNWPEMEPGEGLTEFFSVTSDPKATKLAQGGKVFASHVRRSSHPGNHVMYALDGAVNEEIVSRIGEDTAARAYFGADRAAMDAYENAAFQVYRNPPPELRELRDAVVANMSDTRTGARGRVRGASGVLERSFAMRLIERLRGASAPSVSLAYARQGRWGEGEGPDRQSGGASDAVIQRLRRIATQAGKLRPHGRRTEGSGPVAVAEAGTDVDNVLRAFLGRGLDKFFLLDGAGRAAQALRDKENVVLVTGFSVDLDEHGQPMPETDGPPGTAYLARTLQSVSALRVGEGGKPMNVTVVTDSANHRAMRASLDAMGAKDVKIELFDAPYGPAAKDGLPYDSGARPSARQLLDRLKPDAVVSIELPAHNSVDGPINMRGKSVMGFNSARDALVEVANERGTTTIGVGDGGNEAGVVQKRLAASVQQNIPKVTLPDGTELEFASAVPADHSVTAWNSNLGAQAIGVGLLKLFDRVDLAPDGTAYAASIQACAGAGAVDGVSRVRAAAVDGFSADVHAAFTDALVMAAKDDDGVFLPERPAIVVVFDSSNGALVAHQELEAEISSKTGRAVQFVYVVDHGNAPYGRYKDNLGELAELVRRAMQTGDEIPSAELIVMACNTAHGPHYDGRMDLSAGALPVVNLIETTSGMMLDEGGAHPALFATATTVGTHMYRDRMHELSDGEVAVQEIAAPKWADFVNDMEHVSEDREVRAAVQADVNEIVSQLDPNTTSVWLCCTHYPALESQIRTALDARGMNDVRIFNPMTEQGDVARAAIGWDALPPNVPPLVRNPAPIVITTGPAQQVERDARALTGYENVRAIHLDNFGDGADMSVVHDALDRPALSKIGQVVATQVWGGGALHHSSQTHIFVPNGPDMAAEALDPTAKTMILVGAEQGGADGVAGAGLLGAGLSGANPNNVYVVPDAKTAQSIRLAHAAAGAGQPAIEIFQPGGDPAGAAASLLERVGPASVIAVKVHGRNADGQYYTTRGTRFNAIPLDEVLVQANKRDVTTVGIADAPVYAGWHTAAANEGPWYEVRPRAVSGGQMVNPGSVVSSKYPVTGPTAAIASDGVVGALQAAGKLDDVLLAREQFGAVISVARDRQGRIATTSDQSLEGLRGNLTEAVHELMLGLLGRNVPPDPVPLAPVPAA